MHSIKRIAPDVGWLPISFVNVYFVGQPGGSWILVDSGLPGRADHIAESASARFGSGSRPEAIVLTHGHFDHAGCALALAEKWDVPVYAHPLEMPYLTGVSAYPPPDPTMGGAMAFLSRFMPSGPRDLGPHVRALTTTDVPGAPDWKWIATPGHAPGHISLFRPSDRVLLAGDAFATMDMDRWSGLLFGQQRLSRAGSPFNTDWDATASSVKTLINLRPNTVGAGHGIPILDTDLTARLDRFQERFRRPRQGRYIVRPAKTNER
ncbi:MAG: MBL fold metallo-hydrolase, partial [Chthoniobacterales bacterium]